jgi:hypothetical protein
VEWKLADQTQALKNRRDHYLPQSYLRGFVDPARLHHQQPLWYLDVRNDSRSERIPRASFWKHGANGDDRTKVETI